MLNHFTNIPTNQPNKKKQLHLDSTFYFAGKGADRYAEATKGWGAGTPARVEVNCAR